MFVLLETIEESSYSKTEIERLLDEVEKLKFENIELRGLINSHQVKFNGNKMFFFTNSLVFSKIHQVLHPFLVM